MESGLAALSLIVLGGAVVSNRLAGWNITGPLVFTVAGFLLGNPDWGPIAVDVEAPSKLSAPGLRRCCAVHIHSGSSTSGRTGR